MSEVKSASPGRGRASLAVEDRAVVGVVAAGILIATIALFFTAVNATWVPVWVEDGEADRVQEVREALVAWSDTAEDRAADDILNEPFSRPFPVGNPGIPFFGQGRSSGTVSLESGPILTVYADDGTVLATASGSLVATTMPTEFPEQSLHYSVGVLAVEQSDGVWADFRNVVAFERAAGNEHALTLTAIEVSGAPQYAAANHRVRVVGQVVNATRDTQDGGAYVRVLIAGVDADAWRTALDRKLGAGALTLVSLADCTGSSSDACLDSDTNDATTLDVYLMRIQDGWTLVQTTVAVQIRS